jgi:hypothetical protein
MSFSALISRLNRRDTPLLPRFTLKTKIIFFNLFIIASVFISPRLLAQTAPQPENVIKYKQDAIQTGGNQESWMDEALKGNMVSMLNVVAGTVPDSCFQQNGSTCYAPGSGQAVGGALGTTNQFTASLFSPAASGIEYIASVKDSFLGKPAYAQGLGFAGLQPLIPIWRGFRNAVYLLSSLIFIAIGVMIILKVKISPQATVNIQNSIPGLITSLILVTFSYAIAGLIIDLASAFAAIVIALLFQVQGRPLSHNLVGVNMTPLPILGPNFDFAHLINPSLSSVYFLTKLMLPSNALAALGALGGAIVGAPFAIASAGASLLIGASIGLVLVLLIVTIMLLVWQLQFFFGLIKTYVTIIFKIILAPLEIGLGAIPSMKMGFSSWLTDLIAYVSVFPISIIFLVLANIIVEKTSVSILQNNAIANGGIWMPGLINGGGFPGVVAALSGGIVPAGIGLVAAGIMAKLPTIIPQLIFAIKPSPWVQASEATYGAARKGASTMGTFALQQGSEFQARQYADNKLHGRLTSRDNALNAIFDALGVLGRVKRR